MLAQLEGVGQAGRGALNSPHGMIGTDEVEFFGEPLMILSE